MAKDARIQYYRHEENKGPSFNFKFVLEKATGEYFMWAADDDEWKESYIEKCLEGFTANKSLVLCYSEALKKGDDGKPDQLLLSDISTVGLERLEGIKKLLFNQYRNIEFYGLIKTQIASLYRFQNSFGEDQIFVLFLALHGEIGKTPPGLFINGPGFAGTSPVNATNSLGLRKINVYFGYIFLLINSIKMLFNYDLNLRSWDKIQIIYFIIRRSLTRRFRYAILGGIQMLFVDLIDSIKKWFR